MKVRMPSKPYLMDLAIAVGLMEAFAIGVMSLPIRDRLEFLIRLCFDSLAGIAGAVGFWIILSHRGIRVTREGMAVSQVRLLPLVFLGALFLVTEFAIEEGLVRVCVWLGWGSGTDLLSAIGTDALSVYLPARILISIYNRFSEQNVSYFRLQFFGRLIDDHSKLDRSGFFGIEWIAPRLAAFVAFYECFFVVWQMWILPKAVESIHFDHGFIAHYIYVLLIPFWFIAGFTSLYGAAYVMNSLSPRHSQAWIVWSKVE